MNALQACFLIFGLQYGIDHLRIEAVRHPNCGVCYRALADLRIDVTSPDPLTGIWLKPHCTETKPIWWVD